MSFIYDEPEKKKKIFINELPVLINESNELVCIPHSPDKPVIGVVGQRSSGKSFLAHGMIDRIYWYWKEPIISMNDLTHESYFWASKNKLKTQTDILAKYGERPMPLPIVYIYPYFKGFKPPEHDYINMSIPFEEFLKNSPYFLRLKQSEKYLELNLKHILNCKTPDEIQDILTDKIKNQNVVNTIMASMYKYLNQEITDFNSPAPGYLDISTAEDYDATSDFKGMEEDLKENPQSKREYGPIKMTEEEKDFLIRDFKENGTIRDFDSVNIDKNKAYFWLYRSRYNPLLALVRQNLVPIINTEQLLSKPYFHPYMYFLLDTIIHNQSRDYYFESKNIPIWIHLEEVTRVASTQLKEKTTEKLVEIAQTGRPLRMGMIYVTQDYNKVDKIMRSQTTYLFTFRFKDKSQASQIKSDMGLAEYEENEILHLKKHQVFASTTDHFVIYSPDGNRYTTDKSQKGVSLPPLSMHKSPGAR